MAKRPTAFDRYVDERQRDPAFATESEAARAEIERTDAIVRALQAARQERHLSDEELARLTGIPVGLLTELFHPESAAKVARLLRELGLRLERERHSGSGGGSALPPQR